jgi:hypothetical protein
MKKKLISILIILAIFIGSGVLVFSQQSLPKKGIELAKLLLKTLNNGQLSYNSELHKYRNIYNYCPSNLDQFDKNISLYFSGNGYKDKTKGYKWIAVGVDQRLEKDGGYHNSNSDDRITFRGISKEVVGSQCTYFKDSKELDDYSKYKGTFDYGYYYTGGYDGLNSFHLWLDKYPHDEAIKDGYKDGNVFGGKTETY